MNFRILHISADYPDPLRPDKPKAFSNLVEVAQDFEHRVISVNRLSAVTGNIEALPFSDAGGADHQAVVYPALPRGLRFRQSLQRLAAWIVQNCRRTGFAPDLVHAHKLTVEGTVGQLVARELGVPLAVSIQGKTDAELTARAFWLRALFQSVWRNAALIMPLAPWAQAKMTATLGETPAQCHALPCPTKADQLLAPRLVAEPVIRSAFNLKDSARKNAAGLIRAAGLAGRRIPALRLEIIGGGSPAAFADLSRLADRSALGHVSFLGAVANDEVQALFNSAAAFALVSHRESFGMVFAEALLSGAPCLKPSSQGIEGFFEPGKILLDADPKSDHEIADAMVQLVEQQEDFKRNLTGQQASGALDPFRRAVIRKTYRSLITQAIEDHAALRRPADAADYGEGPNRGPRADT